MPQIQLKVLRSFAQAAQVARTRVERFSTDEASQALYTTTQNELISNMYGRAQFQKIGPGV